MRLEPKNEIQEKPKFRFKRLYKSGDIEIDLKLFVVRQYAEFVSAVDICENIIIGFSELCEADIEEHGEVEFKKYLMRAIYKLTPETVVFPKKYQAAFDVFREEYLKDVNNSYLFHSKNRFQELDSMYDSIKRAVEGENDSTELRHLLQLGLNVMKEARAEQSSSKINIEAKSDGNGVTLTASGVPVHSLTDAELEEQKRRYERGERIGIPGSARSLRGDDTGNGTPERGGVPATEERNTDA